MSERTDFDRLMEIVAERAKADPAASYTAKLTADGLPRIARKLGEEAVETIVAALNEDDAHLTAEAADLLFHLAVLLNARGIPVSALWAELSRRTGRSGLAEKASRKDR
ncbi:MAG: phosphoribosyl-ATP diphosphatase [Flavobacteriaceae bacterium]